MLILKSSRPQLHRWAVNTSEAAIKQSIRAITACKWHACYLPYGGAVHRSMDTFSRGEHRKAAIAERLLLAELCLTTDRDSAHSGGLICAGKWYPKQDDSMRLLGLESLATRHFLMSPVNPENHDGSHQTVAFAFSIPFTQHHACI